MIYTGGFTVVLDANVLYPNYLRDIILTIAEEDLFRPKWSNDIEGEWSKHVLANNLKLNKNDIKRTIELMNTAFPDARVDGYQALIKAAELPDPDDAHVLACAIKCKAQVIVTINLKDFPKDLLEVYDMEPQHPDVFLSNIFDLNPDVVSSALVNMVNR